MGRACREAMGRMKEGEEAKTKSYTALVWTQKAIQSQDIAFIDGIKVAAQPRRAFQRVRGIIRLLTPPPPAPPPGPDSGPEDPPEGSAPAGAGGPSASRPPHEHALPGPPPLPPGAEDAGRDVSPPPQGSTWAHVL